MRVALALSLVVFAFTLHAGDDKEVAHSKDTPEEIKKALDSGKAILVDVREKEEWDTAHVKGAVAIPSSEVKVDPKKAAKDLPKDKPIYIHCAAGGRAARCAKAWRELGYDARPVTYNVSAFEKAGVTVEKGGK